MYVACFLLGFMYVYICVILIFVFLKLEIFNIFGKVSQKNYQNFETQKGGLTIFIINIFFSIISWTTHDRGIQLGATFKIMIFKKGDKTRFSGCFRELKILAKHFKQCSKYRKKGNFRRSNNIYSENPTKKTSITEISKWCPVRQLWPKVRKFLS